MWTRCLAFSISRNPASKYRREFSSWRCFHLARKLLSQVLWLSGIYLYGRDPEKLACGNRTNSDSLELYPCFIIVVRRTKQAFAGNYLSKQEEKLCHHVYVVEEFAPSFQLWVGWGAPLRLGLYLSKCSNRDLAQKDLSLKALPYRQWKGLKFLIKINEGAVVLPPLRCKQQICNKGSNRTSCSVNLF